MIVHYFAIELYNLKPRTEVFYMLHFSINFLNIFKAEYHKILESF